jgi:uncharacterized protein (TIRG00374 family)
MPVGPQASGPLTPMANRGDMTGSNKKKRFAGSVVRATVSIGLIVLIVLNLDTDDLQRTLQSVSIGIVLVLTLVDLLLRVLSAYRWHVLFDSTNTSTGFSETTRISFIASFAGQLLPGVIGVEALRIWGLARSSNDAAGAFASVVAERVFGLLSLVLVIFAGLLIGPSEMRDTVLLPVLLTFVLLFSFVIVAMIPGMRVLVERAVPKALLERIRHWVDGVYQCFDHYKTQPGLLAWSLFLAILFQILRVILFFIAALMIGESPAFIYFIVFVPIVMFASLLPVSIGGLGVREAGLVFLFSQFGVMNSAPTFTVAILVFVSGLLSTLPGGWYYVAQRRNLKPAIDEISS